MGTPSAVVKTTARATCKGTVNKPLLTAAMNPAGGTINAPPTRLLSRRATPTKWRAVSSSMSAGSSVCASGAAAPVTGTSALVTGDGSTLGTVALMANGSAPGVEATQRRCCRVAAMRLLVCVCVLAVVVAALPARSGGAAIGVDVTTSRSHLGWLAAKGAVVKPVGDNTPPVITHEPPGTCPAPSASPTPTTAPLTPIPCTIEAGIVDDSGVFDPTLLFRPKGGAAFERVPMKPMTTKPGRYEAVVPAAVAASGDVEYLIEAFDIEGNGPARAGTEAAPLLLVRPVVAVPPPAEDSTGLVIGVVAGVAVALAIGVGVGVGIYALRPPAPDVLTVTVDGNLPFAAVVP